MLRKFKAKEGYVWKKKNTNWIGSNIIFLGIKDDIFNYEEIPEPIETEPIQEEPIEENNNQGG